MGIRIASVPRLSSLIVVAAVAAALSLQPLPLTGGAADTGVEWTETTLMSGDRYQCVDLEIGRRNIYVMTWEFYTGPVVLLQRSDCWGREWSAPSDVFGEGLWNAFPTMSCYTNGTEDELLIAAGSDIVTKSRDSGETFEELAPLPIPEGCQDWRYMCVGTNASWFGGAVDPDIYVLGSLYVGEYWSGAHKVAFTKSTDWGNTWSEPVFLCYDEVMQTNYPEVVSDGSRLYVAYTKINVSLEGSRIVLKTSDDWGATWSDEVPIPISTPLGVAATGFQYIDEEKAVLTVSTNAHDPLECTGKIGYFHFSDLTYEVVCEMGGPEWCMAAGSFEGELAMNGVYHLAWAHEPVIGGPMSLKYAWSRDVPFTDVPWRTPLMMGDPSSGQREDGAYGATLYGTEPDSGEATWQLRSNGDWLHAVAGSDGSCGVAGTPTETGEFWVDLTVQDGDSTDTFNWTVHIAQAFPEEPEEDPEEPLPDDQDDEQTDDGLDEYAGTEERPLDGWVLAAVALACGSAVVAVLVLARRRP